MSDNIDPQNELTERLSALGSAPISPALQSEHLTALAGVARGASWRSMLASRVKLGAAVLGGFLIGTTGLASAGAMGPLQPIAKTTVEAVTPFEMPEGKGGVSEQAKKNKGQAKKAEKAAKPGVGQPKAGKNWAGCNTAYSMKNRGQYLQSAKAVSAAEFEKARQSDCGKGLNADGTVDEDALSENEQNKTDDDATKDQGKSAEKRQDGEAGDDKAKGERGGKSGVEPTPESTPVEPAPENKPAETPATPDAADGAPKSDNAETPGPDNAAGAGSPTP